MTGLSDADAAMTKDPPIVFIHNGDSWFLPFALEQAALASPGSKIHLLGDARSTAGGMGEDLVGLESSEAARFRMAYRHLSPNPPEFELICFLRWFYLLEFMKREGLEEALYFDSDVLLYSPGHLLKEQVRRQGKDCGLVFPEQSTESYIWTAAGHVSYWRIEALSRFRDYCLRMYEDPTCFAQLEKAMEYRRSVGWRPGISDMTALYRFADENAGRVHNFGRIHEDGVIDNNLSESMNFLPDEYEMKGGTKRVELQDRRPILFPRTGKPVLAHALHFQGARKKLMPKYYTGASFPGKLRSELRLAVRAAPKRFRNWLLGRNH